MQAGLNGLREPLLRLCHHHTTHLGVAISNDTEPETQLTNEGELAAILGD